MSFERYWSIFIKWWQLVAVCFIVSGIGSLVVSLLVTPTYQATALIQVVIHSGGDQSNIDELLASNQLVQTEAALATSDPVLRQVVAHYPSLSVVQLGKMVSATPRLNTQLFAVDVQDTDKVRAARIANDVATTLIQQQEKAHTQENQTNQQQLQQEIDTTQQKIDTTKTQLADASTAANTTSALQERLTSLQQHSTQWQAALAQLELLEAQSSNFLQVMQDAQPAALPTQPDVLLNTVIASGIGLMLGCLLILFFEHIDQRIRTPEALSQIVPWPVLSSVKCLDGERNAIQSVTNDSNIEAYRILRSNIGFAEVDKPLRLLMVTSAFAKEGKSAVAANLALMMARAGKSTLLIDADLRHPTLHEKFGLAPDKQGLSNAILTCSVSLPVFTPMQFQSLLPPVKNVSAVPLHSFIHSVGIPNLGVMPSGPLPPNPSELLSSKAMQRFFSSLKSCGAEIIIFDTVSLLGLADACELASKVDGTIVVVNTIRSRKPALLQAKTMLSTAGAHVIGCVMNQQPRTFKQVAPAFATSTTTVTDLPDKDAGDDRAHFGTTDGIAPVIRILLDK